MAVLNPNIVSSAIFCGRNYDKGNNGHGVRYAVALGQAKKVVDYVSGLDNAIGQTAKTATQALGAASKESIFLEGCGNVAKFSSSHINPLIIASTIFDVANSDNKVETAVVSGSALATMFTGEKFLKKHLKDIPNLKCFKGVTEAIEKATKGTKYAKFVGPVLEGVAFVIGSCMSYSVGEKIGKTLVGKDSSKQTRNKTAF